MKIAITGTNGFVGSYLVKYFEKKGYEIISLNRTKWDLRKKYNGQKINFDIFIHSASDTNYEKSKNKMIENNVIINKNILDLVNNSNCKHFIYISSSSVYQSIGGRISTNIKINKKNLKNSYSLTKFLAEEYIKENLDKRIGLTTLRPRAIYGNGDKVLVPKILKNQIFGKLILPGNGKTKTSVSEINDFVKYIGKIIENKKYGVYNFSTKVDIYENLYNQIVKDYKLKGIIKIPIIFFKFLEIFNKNKYSYIVDTFGKDKILE